ncbi:hypothetical protein [Hymenobacter sp. BT559]|jgi:hypothetical protein|uniref:hypothetical protein n=1 Tax=Hymenobacter sp. BT559 TaxID=2795729 RepID=UPI0018ED187F|nr:hypothetical protein [Hymenobacter sp. BT559]MBJ6144359.1 hypothetical protein [Hymenobacter sp. BT559]
MNRTLRLLALAAALPLALSACNSGGDAGDTNVEKGSAKKGPTAPKEGTSNGDSLAAGIPRDTTNRPTGKELYKAADRAKDRNHDGLAD